MSIKIKIVTSNGVLEHSFDNPIEEVQSKIEEAINTGKSLTLNFATKKVIVGGSQIELCEIQEVKN